MTSKRQDLIAAVGDAVQRFQEATEAFDDVAAVKLGLNRTDLKCASIIARLEPVSIGEIGRGAGLTRGAMTTALDRIEGAGYARRLRHPNDRRGVLVELTEKGRKAVDAIWGEYIRQADAFFVGYSVEELKSILRFLNQACEAQQQNMTRVQKLARKW